MKRLQGFIVGACVTSILMFSFTGFAESISKVIEVTFNSVNLEVNGQPVKVDNILYNDTTYVPMRAVAEMLGKEIGWNGNTSTASINDRDFNKQSNSNFSYLGYKAIVKVNNKTYLLSHDESLGLCTDNSNNYYSRISSGICFLIGIGYNDYKIESSDNPFVDGVIYSEDVQKYIEVKDSYYNMTTRYSDYKFYNSDKSKVYEISTKPNEEKGVITFNSDFLIPLNDLFNKLGVKCNITLDKDSKLIIFSY